MLELRVGKDLKPAGIVPTQTTLTVLLRYDSAQRYAMYGIKSFAVLHGKN
jgi:hypothetical protein